MRQCQKLFFVPVGLPGMGKSTLAKNIRLSIEKNLSATRKKATASNLKFDQFKSPSLDHSSFESANEGTTKHSQSLERGLVSLYANDLPSVEFKKISYDRILGDLTNQYMEEHPSVPFHEVIDIIRPHADAEYL